LFGLPPHHNVAGDPQRVIFKVDVVAAVTAVETAAHIRDVDGIGLQELPLEASE